MLHVEFTGLNFLLVLTSAYFTALWLSWAIHFVQHQTVLGIPVYRPHFQDHHLHVDNPDEWNTRLRFNPRIAFWGSIVGHAMWVVLASLSILLFFLVFSPWIATVFAVVGAAIGFFHWYLHQMSHTASDSWLLRFRWFRRECEFHQVHHLTSTGGDFANARNYAFGDPLSKHVMDYLFGTLDESVAPVPEASAHTAHEGNGDAGKTADRFRVSR